MDAQQTKLEIRHRRRALVVRLVGAWLLIVLGVGLWQGYGSWLLSVGATDAF